MNVFHVAVWGFVATVILTTLMNLSQGLGLTRMNLPFILGTMFTADRDRAKVYGTIFHLLNGWAFAFLYALVFETLGRSDVLVGMVGGLIHAAFVLVVVMPTLPELHPRMAGEQHGPTVTRRLEPPGFLALHYGTSTPISTILAHLVYGGLLGALYRVAGS